MAQQDSDDNIPLGPYLRLLENKIEETSEEWTLETIRRTQQHFSFVTSRLNNVHNSRLAINKLGLDILYIIFKLVVYSTCSSPGLQITALGISHVCHYWRELTLRWPSLWAVLDLENPPLITDLFMTRSQNAPLTLTWWAPGPPYFFANFEAAPSGSYFVSHANSILPRLHSLNVNTTFSNFISLYRVIENYKLPPLQLRHLTIIKRHSFREKAPPLTHLIDSSCLRYIKLCEVDLPWLELPHNRLTHFTLKDPVNPPAFSQLLALLSSCICLEALGLGFRDEFGAIKITFPPTTPTSLRAPIRRLDLPNLTRLKLGAFGSKSYDYIVRFASRIRPLGALSWFNLTYNPDRHVFDPSQHNKPFHIFGAVPSGIFSHLSKYQYLAIGLIDGEGRFKICARTYVSDQHGSSSSGLPKPQFVVNCRGLGLFNDYYPILELIYAMPQIRHLILRFRAWSIFTFPHFDLRKAFPCLHTLALTDCDTEALISLPDGLRVKRLVLTSCTVLFDILFDVVESAGAEVLELTKCRDLDGNADTIISDLRTRGVNVIQHELEEEEDESDESDESDRPDNLNESDGSEW